MKKIKRVVKKLPEHKSYFEAIGAILTIPVLITVILLNLNNLNNKKNTQPSPTPPPEKVIIERTTQAPQVTVLSSPAPTTPPHATCKKEVGPISISYPVEGQTVSDNPVCITIQYDDPSYCSVVWSYKINNGSFSDYSSSSPCLFNIPNGNVKFTLRAQSTVSRDQTTIERNFIYQGSPQAVTPTP